MSGIVKNAPLIIVGFNRADTMSLVLARLSECANLRGKDNRRVAYAFLDGARTPDEEARTEEVAALVEDFKSSHFPDLQIVRREKNYGCRGNIVDAISHVLGLHGRAVIVEDDVLVSRTFLNYMDEALDFYESDKRIWCINANTPRDMKVPKSYKHDVYLHPRNMCWGWGTWKDRWVQVDFDMKDWPRYAEDPVFRSKLDKIDCMMHGMLDAQFMGRLKTWDVQCSYHIVKNNLFAVEPRYALSKNIGSGTVSAHCSSSNADLLTQKFFDFRPTLEIVDIDKCVLGNLSRSAFRSNGVIRLYRKVRRFCRKYMQIPIAPDKIVADVS